MSADKLIQFMARGMAAQEAVDKILAMRSENGKNLAERFPDVRGLPWLEFLNRLEDAGLNLDFVTACEMYRALNGEGPVAVW